MNVLLAFLFTIGLVVRLIRWIRDGGRGGRRASATARQEWAGRLPADEVPVERIVRKTRPRGSATSIRRRG
jgi:hypothetical protein